MVKVVESRSRSFVQRRKKAIVDIGKSMILDFGCPCHEKYYHRKIRFANREHRGCPSQVFKERSI